MKTSRKQIGEVAGWPIIRDVVPCLVAGYRVDAVPGEKYTLWGRVGTAGDRFP